ncbi:MAG: carboxyl transferase domain-containing protein [Burkholderiaceae bacterium]
MPVDLREPIDMREIIARLVDHSEFLESAADPRLQTVCGLAAIHAMPVGIITNNTAHDRHCRRDQGDPLHSKLLPDQLRRIALSAEHHRIPGGHSLEQNGMIDQTRLEDDPSGCPMPMCRRSRSLRRLL